MQRVSVLGSTGSVGLSTLAVIRHFPQNFRIAGLSAHTNINLLSCQIQEFHPDFVCVRDEKARQELALRLKLNPQNRGVKVYSGQEGLERIAEDKTTQKIILAISGAAALFPLLAAARASKDIGLANKEALVMAGTLIMREVSRNKARIIPIDSEQSAIWQCLEGQDKTKLNYIYLTASGGPFRKTSQQRLRRVSVKEVLAHPRWKMGRKISVDSASLMNKGLEVLEAMYLFSLPAQKIRVLIHPQAVVHSLVEFIDGVVLAQLSATDMRVPIQFALSYPERLANLEAGLDFYKLRELNFEQPDFQRFPCLRLAYEAAREGGTTPCVLNAANEVAVEAFLAGRADFLCIPKIIRRVLEKHKKISTPNIDEILEADAWARNKAAEVLRNLN